MKINCSFLINQIGMIFMNLHPDLTNTHLRILQAIGKNNYVLLPKTFTGNMWQDGDCKFPKFTMHSPSNSDWEEYKVWRWTNPDKKTRRITICDCYSLNTTNPFTEIQQCELLKVKRNLHLNLNWKFIVDTLCKSLPCKSSVDFGGLWIMSNWWMWLNWEFALQYCT